VFTPTFALEAILKQLLRSNGGLFKWDLICYFRVGPATQAIFELGDEPKDALFYELTAEQYSQLEKEGEDISRTCYTIIPDGQEYDVPELLIIGEDKKNSFGDAARYINSTCEKVEIEKQFSTYEEKLEYVASKLPAIFSQSSKYAKKTRDFEIVK